MAALSRVIHPAGSRVIRSDRVRSFLLDALTLLPESMLVPVRVERGIHLRIRPRPEDCRYLIPDKEGGVLPVIEGLSPGDTFIDLGAHIGYYSLVAADVVGEDGTVIAFEPHPEHADRTRANSERNGLDVRIEQLAVCDEIGESALSLSDRGGGHALGTGEESLTVSTSTLDAYVREYDIGPDLIKMDIEGAEVAAIEGMQWTLEHHQPRIICEVHPGRIKAYGNDVETLYDRLHDQDYIIKRLPDGTELRKDEFITAAADGVVTDKGLQTHLHILAESIS